MLVTVITDASWDQEGFGGYGVAVKSNRGSRRIGKPFRERWLSSSLAEYAAAVLGIWFATKSGLAYSGDTVLVQSDCLWAVRALRGQQEPRPTKAAQFAKIKDLQAELVETYRLTIKSRHVPGHTRGKTPRIHLNNVCDELARQGRMEARNM